MDEDVDRALREQGGVLADAVEAALPRWVGRHLAGSGADAAEVTGAIVHDVVPRLRALLAEDVDAQRANPLSILRDGVRHITDALRAASVPPPPRRPDGFDAENFPDDDYGLTPMTWRDVDESLHEPGLVWGAMKARASIRRHQQR